MIENTWVGEWFKPEVGRRYMVPMDSINHTELAGKSGVCLRFTVSQFGMSWAWLEISGKVYPVRTCYLIPVGETHD